jgi:endonuclease/exonuclease/phosphatase family metal-dependent hydrolase
VIHSLCPTILFLTEYVPNESLIHGHESFRLALQAGGFKHFAMSKQVPAYFDGKVNRQASNTVFVASKLPFDRGAVLDPEPILYADANYMHVRFPTRDLDVIGLRIPSYEGAGRKVYWKWFEEALKVWHGRRVIFVGDFNADPYRGKDQHDLFMGRLKGDPEWVFPEPIGKGWSFQSDRNKTHKTSLIDHVLINPLVAFTEARYVYESGGHVLVDAAREGISDHAALLVDIADTA